MMMMMKMRSHFVVVGKTMMTVRARLCRLFRDGDEGNLQACVCANASERMTKPKPETASHLQLLPCALAKFRHGKIPLQNYCNLGQHGRRLTQRMMMGGATRHAHAPDRVL